MKERPILFSTDMVKAIFGGKKTMTRRVIKPQPYIFDDWATPKTWIWKHISGLRPYLQKEIIQYCPYGQVGDRLWIRETWREPISNGSGFIDYLADYINKPPLLKWRPSIHMPRWASRINLEITDIKVERVQDITLADLTREGTAGKPMSVDEALSKWISLWNSINAKKYPWEFNPWVWVIEFNPTI